MRDHLTKFNLQDPHQKPGGMQQLLQHWGTEKGWPWNSLRSQWETLYQKMRYRGSFDHYYSAPSLRTSPEISLGKFIRTKRMPTNPYMASHHLLPLRSMPFRQVLKHACTLRLFSIYSLKSISGSWAQQATSTVVMCYTLVHTCNRWTWSTYYKHAKREFAEAEEEIIQGTLQLGRRELNGSIFH